MTLSILALSAAFFHTGMVVLLVVGFGFVIFWHELGHFIAAKAVGIKVEQFAVGFGQALLAWRKGIGVRWGSTQREYYNCIERHLEANQLKSRDSASSAATDRQISETAQKLGLGETEYRLNWIPLGGYVKMLGQDDLRPDAAADDPRAYNRKSVGARMLVISAGVVMNVILAAILFVCVFLIGLKAPPAWVGNIMPQSPAQKAGMQVGDKIVTFDGKAQQDFTKITLDTALARVDTSVPIVVERIEPDGTTRNLTLNITPARMEAGKGFVALGLEAPYSLAAVGRDDVDEQDIKQVADELAPGDVMLQPGEEIVAINGQNVSAKSKTDYAKLDEASQQFGKPVEITISAPDGKTRTGTFQPHFQAPFSGPFALAGMSPRARVLQVTDESSARGKVKSGDAIVRIAVHSSGGDQVTENPAKEKLTDLLRKAGDSGNSFDLTVLRQDQTLTFTNLKATAPVGEERGQKGLGVALNYDEFHPLVGEIIADSPAAKAGLAAGDVINAINDSEVKTWFDIHRLLSQTSPGQEIAIRYTRNGRQAVAKLNLDANQLALVHDARYHHSVAMLAPYTILRKANNPLVAINWGVLETRDFILQFYVTIRRMFEGSVSLSNMMGPYGIFKSGMRISFRGMDWLLWFLAMISANLAVVNFLPIPVVDGGQFVFLCLEKIKGKPLSPRTMAIAQYVGLAFLAAVVVFVTYHDIMRRY